MNVHSFCEYKIMLKLKMSTFAAIQRLWETIKKQANFIQATNITKVMILWNCAKPTNP